jgi:hypothetical protein
MTVQPAPIPEVAGVDRDRFENEIVPAGRPLVVRGLVAGWPAAMLGRQSPEAICKYLIERDTHAPIDAIMLPPEEKGRIFYNAAMDGFNFFRTHQTISRVIEQIARYSAFPTAPAVAAQSALIRSCLPRFLAENPMPLLDAVEPRIWIGNAITVPAHFDDAGLERKLRAAHAYAELRFEVERTLERFGSEPLRTERLWPIDLAERYGWDPDRTPFYESYGAERVANGAYREVVTFRDHVKPLADALWSHSTATD